MGGVEEVLHHMVETTSRKTHRDENNGRPNTRINDPAPSSIADSHISAPEINLEHIVKTVFSHPTRT